MEQRIFMTVEKPPLEFFRGEGAQLQKSGEETVSGQHFDRIEYPEDGGIYAHYYDHPYPTKGQPFPEAVQAILTPKKLLRVVIYSIKAHPVVFSVIFLLPGFITRRFAKTFLDHVVRSTGHVIVRPYLFDKDDPKRYCVSAREIRRSMYAAADKMRSRWKEYYQYFIDMIVAVWEWDNAWRYRGQDGFGELNKSEFLRNPAKEILRICTLMVQRERGWHDDKGKIMATGQALKFVLFFMPEIRKFLVEFVKEVDLDKIKMDEADEYHNLMRPDYDIHGTPMEYRQQKWQQIYNKYQSEHSDRIRQGMAKVRQMQEMMALQQEFTKHDGLPFIIVFLTQEGGQTKLGLVETQMSVKNKNLREDTIKLLESRNKQDEEKKTT